jgi:hypothetical protein
LHCPNPYARPNQFARRYDAVLEQHLILSASQDYLGASLCIPADLVFDAVPIGLWVENFEIDANLLNGFNRRYWTRIG